MTKYLVFPHDSDNPKGDGVIIEADSHREAVEEAKEIYTHWKNIPLSARENK